MVNVLIVGDKPSPKMKEGAKPFRGAACEQRLIGWLKKLEMDRYHIVNQTDYNKEALIKYARHLHEWGIKVVALGNNASKALKGVPHFKLPHPSGLNRQINNKDFIKNQLEMCRAYVRG